LRLPPFRPTWHHKLIVPHPSPSPAIDVSSIVPSTRDFLQALATHKKRLALVPLIETEDDARRLAEAGVSGLAVSAPSERTRAISAAAGHTPLISLALVADENEALISRSFGADAVIIDAARFDALSKNARSTRMAALAAVTNATTAAHATTAKAIYLRVTAVELVAPIVEKLPKGLRVLAHVPAIDEPGLRALRGVVDGAIVEQDMHLSTSFDTLREELDP
jgi:hypothetical protein